jgi:hypothetical protein
MSPSAKKALITVASIVAACVVAFLIYNAVSTSNKTKEQNDQIEKLKLQNDQLQLAGQYQDLDNDFKNYENQTQYIKDDSILNKYTEAKDRVEKLLTELKSQKITSAKRIKELQNEIVTLKGIMRHYVEIIDSLGKENEGLRVENTAIKSQNAQLTSQVANVSQQNESLNKRMVLAEKLNITGLSLTALKGNGKVEKKVNKAKQLMVQFTIPQNNSTPVGNKTLFVRITGPEGSLLGQRGTFAFEGGNVAYTEKKTIEYSGQEVPGVTIYYNVNTTLIPGQYTVEVFADNYRLASRGFTLNK